MHSDDGVDWLGLGDLREHQPTFIPAGLYEPYMALMRRFYPEPKAVPELVESLREMGIVTCNCVGFDHDNQRRLIVNPSCPVHTDRCFACGQKRGL